MVIRKLLFLSYMPTTLYFSYYHKNNIAMLYLVHKYKKKFEYTNMDLTHSNIMIFLAFLVRGYGCLTSHKISERLYVINSFKGLYIFVC